MALVLTGGLPKILSKKEKATSACAPPRPERCLHATGSEYGSSDDVSKHGCGRIW
jgi:hypothetical protein